MTYDDAHVVWSSRLIVLCIALVVASGCGHASTPARHAASGHGLASCIADPLAQRGVCEARELDRIQRTRGTSELLAEAGREVVRDSSFGFRCHLLIHPIGERDGGAAARRASPVPELITDSPCSAGYAHGFVIGYLEALVPRGPQAIATAATTCAAMSEMHQASNCVHSVGHVVGRATREPAAELSACTRAATIVTRAHRPGFDSLQSAREVCLQGTFMEQALRDGVATTRVDQRLDICGEAPPLARPACFRYAPWRAVGLGKQVTAAAPVCDAAPDQESRSACLESYEQIASSAHQCDALGTPVERSACTQTWHSAHDS